MADKNAGREHIKDTDKDTGEKRRWITPELNTLEGGIDDIENGGGPASDGGGRTTS